MVVSDGELAGLAAIGGFGGLPGVVLASATPEGAAAGLEGLRAKGVVDERGCLTRFGVVPVRAVEEYCRAGRHVVVNQLRVSVNGDGALTVLHPAPGGWGLFRLAPAVLMVVLLRAYPFLRAGGEGPAGEWARLGLAEWASGHPADGGSLAVRVVPVGGDGPGVSVFDVRDGGGFEYDLAGGRGRRVPVPVIRARVAALLGFSGLGAGDV